MTPEEFQAATHVSRETLERLTVYAQLLAKWQPRINLVGPATLPDLWRRHMLDSAQLLPHIPPGGILADLGSGAGFPGLVLAILGAAAEVHLLESDSRKAAFLREVARATAAPVTLHVNRIEAVSPFAADTITARALAPLPHLLALAEPFLAPHSRCVFLKGRSADEELTQSRKEWNMDVQRVPSLSDPSGCILILNEVHRGRAQR